MLQLRDVPSPSPAPAEQVRRYYDVNTASFIRRSQAGANGAIHRAVWGPGVANRTDAFRYLDNRIAGYVAQVPGSHASAPVYVLDLGCGVGASLIALAARLPVRATGVTISGVQARLAQQRIGDAGLADRVRVLEGDYTRLPDDIPPADVAYAIESFVHGPSPERFFAEAARAVRPGGRLIVCDDVTRDSPHPAAARTLAQFVRGWHVNSLVTNAQMQALARAAGFAHESTTDLTPYLELGRPRDRAVDVLAALVGRLPVVSTRLAPLIGGSALQKGLKHGWLAFEFVVFRRI